MKADDNYYNLMDTETEVRIDALLGKMTLAEKVGQLVQINYYDPREGGADLHEPLADLIRTGRVGSLLNLTDPQITNLIQKTALEESRLGIPLLLGLDVIHGLRTIFPIPLAGSCTWDPAMVENAARIAAEEASSIGINWIFAPMVDIARDPRWGRIAEGAGEDPFLGMAMAHAHVRGFQSTNLTSGKRIAACPKHFAAYGAAEAGRDYNTVDISERTLRDVHLPPFKAAFDAGAATTMTAFNEIAGVPATANQLILSKILRGEWGWPGLVVSDFESLGELILHGFAVDLKHAAKLSIEAGLDIEMASQGYSRHLADLVNSGEVSLSKVEEAVRRVLRLKIRLGLFENPYTREGLAEEVLLREEHRSAALEVARSSMVLLKNEGSLLPLQPGKHHLAVIGPLADNQADLLGSWAWGGRPEDVESVLEGLQEYIDASDFTYHRGCPIQSDDPSDIQGAVKTAQAADVVLLVLGESADLSGESHSRTHLGLPGQQAELVAAIAETGKPLVCVLMSGRPLVISQLAEQVDALLAAWHGGIRAGRAVADILFGAVNPSGKLTAGWPRTEGQIPVYYGHKNTGRPADGAGTKQFAELFKSVYLDEPNSPLFPFGFGLGYSQFEYDEFRVQERDLGMKDSLVVSARVNNIGERSGAEVVQLYVRDLVGSVTRPVKELKGFKKVWLEPGESQVVRFEVPVQTLGFTSLDMRYTVEPGDFMVWIGPDSTGGLEGEFRVVAED